MKLFLLLFICVVGFTLVLAGLPDKITSVGQCRVALVGVAAGKITAVKSIDRLTES